MGCIMRRTNKLNGSGVSPLIHVVLIILGGLQIFPLVTLFLNTFRTDSQIKAMPIGLPTTLNFKNYMETWIRGGYTTAFRNSLLVGAVTIVIVLIACGLAGYSIVKMNLPWKNFFTGYFMLVMSLPSFLYIIPDYFLFHQMKLVNNLTGIIILYAAGAIPFNLLLIRTFLIGIPKELEEASRVDGCNELRVFLSITVPLAKPILTTVALLVFVSTWNEFLFANTFLTNDNIRTVATRFVKFTGEWTRDMAKIFTAGAITLLPIIVLYLFLQQTFIEGMTKGGLKG